MLQGFLQHSNSNKLLVFEGGIIINKIIILTLGKWRFAVEEEAISMISNYERHPIEGWQNNIGVDAIKDIKAINESKDNHFSNFIYFLESGKVFCLGVDSLCYPTNDSAENYFYFGYSGENDGIIGLYTENEDIVSIVDLGKFLEKWLGS